MTAFGIFVFCLFSLFFKETLSSFRSICVIRFSNTSLTLNEFNADVSKKGELHSFARASPSLNVTCLSEEMSIFVPTTTLGILRLLLMFLKVTKMFFNLSKLSLSVIEYRSIYASAINNERRKPPPSIWF